MHQESSNINEPLNLENAKKGKQLIGKEQIDTSPLEIVEVEDKGFAVIMGNMRLTDWYTEKETLDQYTQTWDFLIKVIGTILEKWDEFKKSEPTNQ